MEKLKVFTAFSGYDSQLMSLDRLNVDYDCVGWSEIDKYAIQAHDALYPQYKDRNFSDIARINWTDVPDFDLFTYSFPCTDISSAGKREGLDENSGTRSSLLWECRKAIIAKQPKYLLMENVRALMSKTFMPYLMKWINFLETRGYKNYTQILNAKDYGIPQNRERVFVVSIRKDVDINFIFPQSFRLEKRLKDVLEKDVDEGYYLSQGRLKGLQKSNRKEEEKGNGFRFIPKTTEDVANTIGTLPANRKTDNFIIDESKAYGIDRLDKTLAIRGNEIPSDKPVTIDAYDKQICKDVSITIKARINDSNTFVTEPKIIVEGNIQPSRHESGNVLNTNGISKTVKDNHGYPCLIKERETDKILLGYTRDCKGNIVNRHPINVANTICAQPRDNTQQYVMENTAKIDYRIRKLTPRECFRLMGVSEKDIDTMLACGISKSRLYKLAGNSIVVDVLYCIFRNLLMPEKDENKNLTLF